MRQASSAAVLCLYSYLWAQDLPTTQARFADIVGRLPQSDERVQILQNAALRDEDLAQSRIGGIYYTQTGAQAFFFVSPTDKITLVYRGTGRGEWADNGQGLSGQKTENTYDCFGVRHSAPYATTQQAQALELFCSWAQAYHWKNITVAGHSKGGNKAQFVTLCSDIVEKCYSFDGQGFSPETIAQFEDFERRRDRITSISAQNDYVNVLGVAAAREQNRLFCKSSKSGLSEHRLEAILQADGQLNALCEQGAFSQKLQSASARVMALPPRLRRYATTGLMNLVQEYVGAEPVGAHLEDFI